MKISDLSSKKRSSYHWINFAAASLLAVALAGCGGGGGSGDTTAAAPPAAAPAAPAVPSVTPPTGLAAVTLTATTPAATFAALTPAVTVGGVAINSPPVVTFAVSDGAATNNPIIGLGSTTMSSTATVASYPNLAFSLAKLVPGTSGSPSKWVSYIVTTVPTKNATTGAITASVPSRPTTDNTGTLVDNKNGTYTYTFYRDIKKIKDEVAAATLTGANVAADLGDLTYDPTLVHRLTIAIFGNAPGTGTNQPDGVQKVSTDAVPMTNPVNIVYDFIPATGKAVTTADAQREIVATAKCNECHNKLGGIPNKDSTKAGFHGGARYNTQYCVVCHTEQRKYGRSNVASTAGAFPALTETKGTVNAFGSTGNSSYAPSTYVADGEVLGDFPVLIHKIHFGNNLPAEDAKVLKLTKTNYNYANVLFNSITYPQSVLNCTKCHDGTAAAANATAQGDNWKGVPSRKVCGACHDGIVWDTGTGNTLNLKPTGSTTNTNGHIGGAQTDDAACALCHKAVSVALYHSRTGSTGADASKRTMSAEITGVTIDVAPTAATATSTAGSTGTGNVTVTFKLTDAGVAVTNAADVTGWQFTLAKLNPAANGSSTNWQSYTARARTKDPLTPPVIQGYSEAGTNGTLTHTGNGVWTYKFALLNASTAGDIRTINHVHNASATSITGAYSAATMPTLDDTSGVTQTAPTTVSYDWWKTHRVGMEFSKAAGSVNNKFNAIYDFVPLADSARKAETRNIVSMNTCATCHGGVKLHKGYTTEYCVTCHNQYTSDPYTGTFDTTGTIVTGTTVDLQRLVHKAHMGSKLPSVLAGGAAYSVNRVSFAGVFPGIIKDCAVCHSATAKKADGTTVLENAANWYTTPTQRACGTCHDGSSALAHIAGSVSTAGVEQCQTCHKSSSAFGLDVASLHKVK